MTAMIGFFSHNPWLLSLAGLLLLAVYRYRRQQQLQRQQQLRDWQQLPEHNASALTTVANNRVFNGAAEQGLASAPDADPFLADYENITLVRIFRPLISRLLNWLEYRKPELAAGWRQGLTEKLLQLQLITPLHESDSNDWLRRQWLSSAMMVSPVILLLVFAGGLIPIAELVKPLFLKLLLAALLIFISSIGVLLLRLKWRLNRVTRACEQALPQALEQLARAVSAGMGVHQALAQVVTQLSLSSSPVEAGVGNKLLGEALLARELDWLLARLRIGDPAEQVIELAGQRLPLISYRFFGMTLLLNLQTGGRLAQVLARQSAQLKQAQRAKHKLDALTSEPRLSANVVAAIPVLMLGALAWLNPQHLDFLLNDDSGQTLLTYCLASIVTGLVLIRLMVIGGGR